MIHGFTLLVHPPPGPTSSTDASREDRLRRVLDSMIKKVLSHGPAVLQKMDFPSFHGKSKMDQKMDFRSFPKMDQKRTDLGVGLF